MLSLPVLWLQLFLLDAGQAQLRWVFDSARTLPEQNAALVGEALALSLGLLLPIAASSMLLPAALLPVPAQVVLTPLAALPIAVFVADHRAYRRWRGAARAPLGARLLRACSDGVLWWCWWRPVVG